MDVRALIMGLAFAFMWASAFTSARIIVADAPPLTALAIRFALSGVLAVVVARAMGQTWNLTRAQAINTVVFGLCQNALYLGLNFVAMQWVEASVGVIIASTMPLIVALLAWAAFGERPKPLGFLGIFLGIAGVAVIMGSRFQGGALDLTGVALMVIGAIALAVATLSVKGASSGGNVVMIVGLQMLVGSAILAVAALSLETWEVTWSVPLGLAFAYTTLIPGLAATLVWFFLVQRIGALRAAVFHFLTPFMGVAVAAVVLGEAFGWLDVLGVAIVTAGIWAVQRARQPST